MNYRTWLCLGFSFITLLIFEKPSFGQLKAQFTSNIQSGCAPLVVEFADESKGNPSGWNWDLGNGTKSTKQTPYGTYFDPGTYTIKLVVKNGSGSDSIIKTNYITVYANPSIDFTASPTQGCYPLDVKFTNDSKAGSGTITDYLWDFGDGNVSDNTDTDHIYTSAGTFNVTLKIINSYGCTNAVTKTKLIHIDDGATAGFLVSSIDVCKTPAIANFKNTSNGEGTLTYLWNFGDGNSNTSFSPSHVYNSTGTYNVLLTVQSSGGCSDTASAQVIVAVPTSSIQNTDATCSNQTISFTNASVPKPVSNTWYFGDGSSSTDLNPGKTYTKTGTYTVKLVNKFSADCSDSITKTISIAAGPSTSFTANDTTKCSAPLSVNFTNTTTGNAVKYIWDFGDGTTLQDVNPNHVYKAVGTYTVKLTAINSNGCQTIFKKIDYINIEPIKITHISSLPDSGCIPFTINPSVQININTPVKTYVWDFGDGTTASGASPLHTYIKEGIFTVKVTIVTPDGCTDVHVSNNAVFVGHKPKANFITAFDTVCPTSKVKFINASTNGPITFLQWNYGTIQDSASGQNYYYQPNDTGYHKITLIAFNYGCSDTLTKPRALYALPPFANIDFKLNCTNKTLVNFADSSVVDIKHTWDFGDGKTDTSKNPVHNYAAAGIYTVNLYTENKTCKDTATQTIHVINEAGEMYLASNIYCRGNNVIADITGINESNVKTTKWGFGDGTILTVKGATKAYHTYVVTGKFLIAATMTDLNGCPYIYTSKDSITVFGPLADFISLTTGVCKDSTIIFKDKSQSDGLHNIVKWSWDYGDKILHDYNSLTAFSHTYNDTGTYTIKLFVTDSYGCTDSLRRNNYVNITHPYASFLKSDSIVCPGSQVSFQNTTIGNGLNYSWYFGDGSQSTLTNPSYGYNKSGVFIPSLAVVDVNGCRDSIASKPLIVSKPAAIFSMSDSVSSCPPLQVNFTNNSTNYSGITWNFGDGSTSTLASPSHIYTYPGTYIVKLNLKGYGDCAAGNTKNVIIKGPTGNLLYDSLPQCYPAKVNFSAAASHTKTYTWDFSDGDAEITSKNKISHTYDTGFYLPKLILTDSLGCKVAITGKDTIKIYSVTANATVSGTSGCDSAAITFKDASQSQDEIIHHIWYFGDKYSSDASEFTHTYNRPGSYNAKLIAITKLGCRDTFNISKPIIVLTSPVIKIDGDTAACASAIINFKGKNNSGDSLQWKWKFDNGSSATGQTASTSYTKAGTYSISLIANNIAGCSDTTSHSIKINAAPKVYAGPDTSVCEQSAYQLTATGAVKYLWQGAGLSCTNCQSPGIKVDSVATYQVTGTDAIGCIGSDLVTVKPIKPSPVTVSGSDTLCVGEKTQFIVSGAAKYQWYPPVYLDNPQSAQPVFTASKDTSLTYKVVGYSEHNCFADTGYVSIKTYPVPHVNIPADEIVLNVGASVRLLSNSSPDITSWQWQPVAGLNNAFIAEPLASPKQTTTYSVVASNGGGCVSRDQITVEVICKNTSVFIPNTFSPNNDGVNEIFYPRGTGLFNVKSFRIFNRWGQLVFERYNAAPNSSADGWNGKFNNKDLQSDVYIYMMEVICENGFSIPLKGNVTLLR